MEPFNANESEQNEQFRLLAEEVEEYAVFLLGTEGHVESWNQGAEKIKGYAEEEILGEHFSVFYPEEEVEAGRPEAGLETAARTGDWTDEGWRVRKDGSQFWARVTITALTGEDGELIGFAKVTRDLTDRRREQELARQKQEAEKAKEDALQARQQAEAAKEAAEEARRQVERENRLLRLSQEVTRIANEADSLEEALEAATEAVCEHIGWPVGHVWVRRGEGLPLVSSDIWHLSEPGRFESFRRVTEETHFDIGGNLPGRVVSRRGPAWIEDVADDPDFIRSEKAEDFGVKGAFAVPVQLPEEKVAVLGFFSDEREEPGEKVMEAIGSVGTQLSRVAEREQAREEVRQSEKRYRRLFEEAEDGIVITTPEGEVIDANAAALEIFGFSREEMRSINAAELYVDPEERAAALGELQAKGAIEGREYRFYRADGEEITCRLSASVLRRDKGDPVVFVTFFRDVTERKRMQQALEESEEKFRKLAEGALVGVGLIQEGVYEYLNPALAEITGYSREELLGTSPKLFVHPEDWPDVQKQIQSRIEGETDEVRYETRVQRKDGQTRHVEVAGVRITYQGKPAAIATIEDITERRQLQQEILEVQEAERRRIGQELHDGAASELTGATFKLSVLLRKATDEEVAGEIEETRSIIEKSAEGVRRLSRGLNPGGLSEGSLPSALGDLANRTEGARFENLLRREEEPGAEGELFGDQEATHLYRIAQEATMNARRHGEADEITLRLRRGDESGKDALLLEVEDDGEGFDPSEVREKGVGLRSMRHRTELMGAELEVDSAPGEGTLVRCRLTRDHV